MGQPPNVLARKCASRRYLALVASKWSLLVINALDDGPARNGSLMRKVEGIRKKCLPRRYEIFRPQGSSSVTITALCRRTSPMN